MIKSGTLAVLLTLSIATSASAQSGGTFEVKQSVIAGGGQTSSGGIFGLDGTIGQSATGPTATGAGFALQSGFWTSPPLAPTAAPVTLTGRITSRDRIGLRRIFVEVTNAATGEVRLARPNTFGYFRFEGLSTGLYIVRGVGRNLSFAPAELVVGLDDDVSGIEFVASRIVR